MSAANRCRIFGLSQGEAERIIASEITRPPSPSNEIWATVSKAYSTAFQSSTVRPGHCFPAAQTPVPIAEIRFEPAKLKAAAKRIESPHSWRHWLWERSSKRPECMNGYSFLANLFQPGETVLVFDQMESKLPLQQLRISRPMNCRVPDPIQAGGRYKKGIWYLCNPVDGQRHWNPRQESISCRSEESITAFRYAVLESDQAPANLWLAFIAQLPVRISAIYTSGGRSIHTLIRLDAQSKAEWDSIIAPLKRGLKVLGTDPACLSAVRLTRLPQCWRPEKNGFQKLLFLCPNPLLTPLAELPVIHSRAWTLDRWRHDGQRGNPQMEGLA